MSELTLQQHALNARAGGASVFSEVYIAIDPATKGPKIAKPEPGDLTVMYVGYALDPSGNRIEGGFYSGQFGNLPDSVITKGTKAWKVKTAFRYMKALKCFTISTPATTARDFGSQLREALGETVVPPVTETTNEPTF